MLKVLGVVVCATLAVVTARAANNQMVEVNKVVTFKDCGSVGATITQVDVNPCPEPPCPFKKNTNVTVHVTFTAKEEITSATTSVHGIIAGVPVPFPLPDTDACSQKHMTCPISKGSTATYTYVVPVKSVYPDVRLVVKWEVIDQNKKDILCFEVPVEIKS